METKEAKHYITREDMQYHLDAVMRKEMNDSFLEKRCVYVAVIVDSSEELVLVLLRKCSVFICFSFLVRLLCFSVFLAQGAG